MTWPEPLASAFTIKAVVNLIVTALGASLLWAFWGEEQLKGVGLYKFSKLFGLRGHKAAVLEFTLFVAIGTIVAWVLAAPEQPRQALAAGMGWTGLFARPAGPKRPSSGRKAGRIRP